MNTFYLDTTNKTANFKFNYNKKLQERIKDCALNTRWNDVKKEWIVPINKYSKENIKFIVSRHDFKQVAEPRGSEVVHSYEKTGVDYAYLKGLTDAQNFTYTPRKYQLEYLAYCLEKGNVINGDDVGLGKTFQSIIYTEVTNKFPCLVVVPASVKYNWKEKWGEITNYKRSISVIESNKKDKNNWDAEIIIINYDILGKKQGKGTSIKFPELVETQWKMIIFDEAHFLKESSAQRSAASRIICKKSKEAIIQMLTGTAVLSKPVELWNLLYILKTEEKVAGTWMYFIKQYCGAYRGNYGWVADGATNTLELNKKLREVCYVRREKSEVIAELPAYITENIWCPITNKRKIDRATSDFISYIYETKGDEAAEKAMEAEHLVAISELKKLSIEGKLKGIIQYLKDWKTVTDKKMVIFGLSRDTLIALAEKFKGALLIGGTSSEQKQKIIKNWIADDTQFLFANIDAAGTGVDGLQKVCTDMAIIELPWRPSDIEQVIGRLHRSGQTGKVVIRYLLSKDTIDVQMQTMLHEKKVITEAVNKGKDIKHNPSGLSRVINKLLKL